MNKKVMLIIVCGGTGSGKTTVANGIQKILPKSITSTILSMDHFYKPHKYMQDDIYLKQNFDHPNAFDWKLMFKDLSILLKRKTVALPIYDYKTSQRTSKTQSVQPVDVVIFEGILSLYDQQINNLASIKIFVDTPADERFIRRLVRDKKERGRNDDDIIGQWRNTVRVMHEQFINPLKTQADIIVPWYHMNQIAIDAIKGAIESIYHKN